VKNEQNGGVYIEAEADEEVLKRFAQWCQRGPEHALVTSVEIKEGELKGATIFEITR
jgi:acylphosphatase